MEHELGRNRLEQLRILQKVDALCRRNNLEYTIFLGTMLSQHMEEGESDWLRNTTIALLYPDYLRLLELIKEDYTMYIFNRECDDRFNALYSWVCSRSRVELSPGRESDLPHYDYHIIVYPIFYVADTMREYRKFMKQAKFHFKCMMCIEPIPYVRGLKKKKRRWKKMRWCKKRDIHSEEREAFFTSLYERGGKQSKYIWIPMGLKQKGIFRLGETYKNMKECRFAGMNVFCIQDNEAMLDAWYKKKARENLIEKPLNRAVMEGPEVVRRVQMVALENLLEFDRICKKHSIHYILSCGTLLGAVRHKGFVPWDDDIDIFILEEEWKRCEEVIEKELDHSKFFLRTHETDQDDNLVFYQIKRNDTVYIKSGRETFNTHRGIALDIIPFFNSPNNLFKFMFQDKVCHYLKTMIWAHMGWTRVKRKKARFKYWLMSRVPTKKAYQMFYKLANTEKEPSAYLTYLCAARNPYHKGFNQRKFFEDTCEMEFEGHYFPVPRDYDEFLRCTYGNDYLKMPIPTRRVARHLPDKIELGDLYCFDK